MTITQLAAWVMLAFGGLFSGGILIVAVERANLWQRMPVEQYVIDFRRSLYRLDPMLPIMGTLTGWARRCSPGTARAARRCWPGSVSHRSL
jgi:hypothetical protein